MNQKQERFIKLLTSSKVTLSRKEAIERAERLGLKLEPPFITCELASPGIKDIDNILDELCIHIESNIQNCLCYVNEYNNIQIIINKFNNDTGVFDIVKNKINDKYRLEFFMIVSNSVDSLEDLSTIIQDTHGMMNYRSFNSKKNIIYFNDANHLFFNTYLRYTDIYDNVINDFLIGNLQKMAVDLSTLAEDIRQKPSTNKTSIRRALIEITIRIINIAEYNDIDTDALLCGEDPYRLILSMNKTEDIIKQILDLANKLIQKSNKNNIKTNNINITKAIRYIEENLEKEELSLQTISDYLKLNSSYFSKLFVDNIGIGVANYINNIRILKAKKLLIETKTPINIIAKQCGYSGITYFSNVFKKRVGITAVKFRNNKNS